MTTVAQLLLERADDDHIGLRYEDESWTWRQVAEESAARASWMLRIRQEGPFHIGVLLDNEPGVSLSSRGGGLERRHRGGDQPHPSGSRAGR